ncbi:hypothetical protein GW17_00061533 [Ensete ventricosum]|nr:hypothetical protein GW17_00061533 [Ensete ventricosum]
MSQDRFSSLFPNRVTEEAIPLTPTTVTIPQVTVAPSAPHARLMDTGQSTLTPNRYWRLLTDPGLTPLDSHLVPNGYSRGLLRVGPSSTSLDKDDAGYHSPYSSVCPNNDSTSAGALAASGRPRGLSGTCGASLTWPSKVGPTRNPLRHVNKWLDEVQKEVTKLKEEVGESSKRGSPFDPEIQDKSIPISLSGTVLGINLGAVEEEDRGVGLQPHTTPDNAPQLHMNRDFPPNKGEMTPGTSESH